MSINDATLRDRLLASVGQLTEALAVLKSGFGALPSISQDPAMQNTFVRMDAALAELWVEAAELELGGAGDQPAVVALTNDQPVVDQGTGEGDQPVAAAAATEGDLPATAAEGDLPAAAATELEQAAAEGGAAELEQGNGGEPVALVETDTTVMQGVTNTGDVVTAVVTDTLVTNGETGAVEAEVLTTDVVLTDGETGDVVAEVQVTEVTGTDDGKPAKVEELVETA